MAGDLDDDAEARALALRAQWGCGVEACGRTPRHDQIAAAVTTLQGRSAPPTGCPLAALYHSAPPLVSRAARGLARMEQGWSDANAFPGGALAVDVLATDILRRGQNARAASDDALREKERKQRELAQNAAKP